jgi:hypothetical protein
MLYYKVKAKFSSVHAMDAYMEEKRYSSTHS